MSKVEASGCSNNLESHHDFVAIVEVVKESNTFKRAYDAKVERVIYESDRVNSERIGPGFTFTLVESMLIEKEGINSESKRSKRFSSISTSRCDQKYKVGTRVRLFAERINEKVYRSSSSWTREVDENS